MKKFLFYLSKFKKALVFFKKNNQNFKIDAKI